MQKFLRSFVMLALLFVPWLTQGQNARVSEYDGAASTATYSTIVGTTGATAWTAADQTAGYVDIAMPFAMQFGETAIAANSTLRVYGNGSATFESVTGLEESRLAPLYYATGYGTTATSVYTKSSTTSLTVEWRKVTANNANSYSFQLKLYSNGEIEFCYGPMTLGGSISVFTGLMSSSTDVFRARGEGGTLYWNTLERATDYATRTLSSNYYPAEGTIYTFTQPACVKPTGLTATATAWNTIELAWTVSSNGSGYELKYSTDPDFDPNTQGTSKSINNGTTLTYTLTGLTASTTYYFYVRKNCSSTPSAWNAVKASATTPSGCPTLSAIASSEVTATGATLSWTPSVAATSYEVRYNLGADFDPDENEGTLVTSTDTVKALTGLTGASTYYYYVRAICVSSLTTDWYGPYIFNTLCGTQNVPYTQNFAETITPMCWSTDIVEGTYDWDFSLGSYAYFTYTDGAVGRLITPLFDISAAGNYQVDFYHAECNWSTYQDSLYVYYRTSATGEWVLLGMFGNATDNSNIQLEHTTLALPNPSATYQLAFEGQGHDGYGVYLTGITVGLEPTCPTPSGIAATTEGVVTWTAGNNNTSYDLVYGPAGFTSLAEGTLIENITGTTYTLTGLAGSTSYDVYVRAHCSATNETNDTWVGPANFITPCAAVVINNDNSLTEDFESATVPAACWNLYYASTSSNTASTNEMTHNTDQVHSGSRSFRFSSYSNASNYNQYLISPELSCVGPMDVSFWYRRYGSSDNIQLGYSTTGNSVDDFTWFDMMSGSTGSWVSYENTVPAGTKYIAIHYYGNYAYYVWVDDLSITKAPTCKKPISVSASGVTATEATLTWVEAGLSTQWEVKVGPRGFNPDEEGTSYTVNVTPTLALDYLYMVTEYDAYVRAICDPEGPTEWSNVCEFKTFCPNGGSATIGNGTSNVSGVPVYSSYGNTFSQMIFTAEELAAAGLQAGNIAGMTFTWNNNPTYAKEFTIYIGHTDKATFSSKTDYVAFSNLTQVYGPAVHPTGTSGQVEYTFTTPFTWDGTSNIVVSTFMNQYNGSTGSSGFTAIGGAAGATRSLYRYRDSYAYTPEYIETNQNGANATYGSTSSSRPNVTFIAPCDTGSCNAPTTVIALSETEYAATLTFTDVNGETNPTYGIVYGPQGFDPATAGTTVSPITNSTYTISNLVARTSYDVYVYAICSGTNGRMVKYNFVTPFIPNCKTPIIDGEYGASNITYNTATLTWRQPGDAPLFWTVRYADADFDPATAAATAYTELTIQGTAGATAQLTGLVAGTTYYIYIKATCATAPDLDESPWLQMSNAAPAYTFTTPTCVTPTAVAASDVTNSTAMIRWTSNATAWTVKYGLQGFDPDNEGTEVACTADSIELTGLAASAPYEVYVKANCTATDESGWSAVCNFATACPGIIPGSDYVATIGEGTSNTIGVPVANYGSTYCQQIFTAEELTAAGVQPGNINSLSFNWQAIDASFDKYFTIWLAQTNMSSFASTSDFVPYSDLTQVYGPVFIEHGTGAGEQEYVFNNAFPWDGSSNIVVVTLMNAGASDANASRRAYTHNTGVSNITMYQRKDNSQYTEEQLATITGYSRSTYRANITFSGAVCDPTITCFAPATVTTEITPANVVTVNWAARTDLRPVVNNFELKYGPEGFDPDATGVLVPALNNVNTYIINAELAANTPYDVYVRTVCDADNDDYSDWAKASFTTNPTCWIPVDLTVTGTTTNSATLSWANDSLAPTQATRWEVCYGPEGFGDPEYYGTKEETTNNTAFTVTGLNHSTKYEFYVRAICNATDHSDWSTVATQRTQCGVWQYADMPFTENFDGYTGNTSSTVAYHVMPDCWSYLNTATNTTYKGLPSIYNSTTYAHSTPNTLRFYSYNASTDADQYAILPEFGFNLDTLEISFYGRFYNTSSEIRVGVMSDPTDASTFELVQAVTAPSSGYSTQNLYEVSFSEYAGTGRYVAFMVPKAASNAYRGFYMDDLTVKLREKVNTLPNNGGSIVACNEFIMPDTTGGNYSNNMNATYVVRPAQAGYVARLQGDYDLENGYDFLNVYRGTATAANLIGRYTGTGSIDEMTHSELWSDSGYFTLVLTSDIDNALPHTGFKFLVTCEQPYANPTPIEDVVEANGTYTWTAGNSETYTNHSTLAAANDLTKDITIPLKNVADFDSVYRHLTLTVHPTYEISETHVMCDRDSVEFYGQTFTTTGNYTVTLQSVYGADSVGVLALQVNPAPLAMIYHNNQEVETIDAYCDNAELVLEGRSNVTATYKWENESTDAIRTVTPHESNTYSVIATNPTTGCTSLPATVTVTTTPVPDLTVSGTNEICYGQSTTLTVADANALDASYVWKKGTTNVGTGTTLTVNPTETTTYTVTATTNNASACAITAEYTVTVNPLPVIATPTTSVSELCLNETVTLNAQVVDGYTYEWNTGATTAEATTVPTATAAYTVTVTDQNGCVNEFTTAAVTVHPSYEMNEERSACIGMLPYTWGAQTLGAAGSYDQTFTIAHGCDSLVHLTFVVEDTAVNNAVRELCEGVSFTFGEGIYEQAYTATASTVLTYVDTTSGECPARYNLSLTVNTHNPATVENTVCDTYTWPLNGETYTVSGAYQTTLQTTKGCDSLVTLNLTVNYQNTGIEEVATTCDSYTWALNGETYTEPTNEPTFTLQNQWGCDSVVTLNLAEVKHSTTGVDSIIYCASTEYTWINGRTYRLSETSGNVSYTLPTPNAQGCDTTSILNLTMNYVLDSLNWKDSTVCDEFVIDTVACDNTVATAYIRENGDYKLRIHNATTGNDQILRLHLTVVPSSYHTTMAEECLPYTWKVYRPDSTLHEVATITEAMVNGANPFNMSVDLAEAGFVASGCASIEVLRLTPKYPTTVVTDTVVICDNGSWSAPNTNVYNGANYTSGIYTWDDTDSNAAGCKLTKQVDLTVNPTVADTVDVTYCESEFVNGIFNYIDGNDTLPLTIDVAGLNENVYTNTLTADWATDAGCARTVTVNYTVNPIITVIDTVQALTEYEWDVNEVLYKGLGEHFDTVTSSNDSICMLRQVLYLTITDSIRVYDTINVCTSYEVNGVTYVEDMTFVEPIKNTDSVLYTTYHVMQRTFNEVYVVSNMPYTWINGVTYTADTNNVYYGVPAVNPGECDSVYKLTFTMVPEIVICEVQVPYETGYGFTIDTTVSDVWNNNDANGNDTIIAYTVKLNVDTTLAITSCDSYIWNDSILGDTTIVESGLYKRTYDAANGCDSIVTLTLTINASTASTLNDTACDSYTWNAQTYDSTGTYTYTTTNLAGCDSTATLNLVINKNNGIEETVTACDNYTWNGVDFTADTNVTKSFNDANGCAGDSVLHLTVNYTVTGNADSIVNAASIIYRGVLYEASYDGYINDTTIAGAANGCDSITVMHLQVNMGTIVTVDTVSCGDFTWLDGNTYTWIPKSERLNPAFNYKNLATNQPVEDFPVFEVDTNADDLIDVTYVLHLVMAEASTEYKTVTVLLSNTTYTDPLDVTNHVFDFTAERNAGVVGQAPIVKLDTLSYGSTYYCDSIVYYTFNLVYNYVNDDTVTVCYTDSVYTTQNGTDIALTVGNNAFTDTTAAGTDNAMVHNMVYVRRDAITGTQTLVACDTVTWNNTLFPANVVDSLVTLTAANGCDSVVTLNITITPTIHNVVDTNVCDTFYWADKDSTYKVSTTDTWSRANTTNAQCTDVDTLKLVVRHMTTSIDSLVACDSLVWIDGITYYASNSTATDTLVNAAGCDSVITLNLTINNSVTGPGNDIDTLGASITLTDKNGTFLFLAPYDNDTTLTLQTVAGCDSVVNFHLTVSQFQIVAENPIECGMYVWPRNNHMYQWISDDVKAANAINIPGASPMLPLYKDVTADVFVYSNPLDTVGDKVYLLNLNLNEAQFVDSTIARFPQSVGTLTLHGTNFNFEGVTSATKLAVDTTVYLTLPNATLCGTVMKYNVHVVYDSITDDTTVCYTTTYTWEDNTTSDVNVGSGNVITKTLFADNWDSLCVVTRTITVRANNNTYSFDVEACDTYTWNDSVYTTTNVYTQTFTDQYGCDSVATLNLTMKYNTNSAETLAACDSTVWNGLKLYATGDTTYSYTAGNGCASVDTLHLTINHNVPQVTVVNTCDSYTWALNGHEYLASDSNIIATRTDTNGCNAKDTLRLTIRKSSSYDSVLYVTDGSYRYTSPDTTALIMAGNVATFAEHYTNAAGCDSTLNIEIHVGEGAFAVDDTTVCNSYTWRDGNTYVWISAEERADNNNALYKNQTTGAYVKSNPIYSVPNPGSFDSIYMLRLNLTQNYTYDTTINFPITLDSLVYGDSTFYFGVNNDEGRVFVNTIVEREVHFASAYYCDSIHYLTINLQNNYSEITADNADICVTQSSYTWRGHELSTATNDYDHAHTYYMYDTVGTTKAPEVEYIKVTQHPVVYATERRTACDSYEWNDSVYTESTSNATFTTTNMYGCDSTVTLMLNIKKSTSSELTASACETYTWSGITFTESTDTTLVGLTNAVGCDSTATLHLTVNYRTDTIYTVVVCDSYKWENGDNVTYTNDTIVSYSYDDVAGICTSVDSLYLTILHNTNAGTTVAACDSYIWHDSTYTVSGNHLYEYTAENGCASVDTLHLTINVNNGLAETQTVCDSIDWNGHVYYATGEYTIHYADANGCEADSVLTLTVNNSTNSSETVVACDSYTWNNNTYSTSGVYTFKTNNVAGCDSTATLNLTIHHSDFNGENYATMTVSDWCGDYTWVINDSTIGTYTESVETSTTFTSTATGCDSVVFLNLTIKHAPVIDTIATVCENNLPYTWRGIEMNAAGVETVTFPLDNGCDSTIRFTLTVNPKYETSLLAEVCLGAGYTENNFNITAEELPEVGEYTFVKDTVSEYGCDSTVTLTVKVMTLFTSTVEATACNSYTWDLNTETYNVSGEYVAHVPAVNNGCDSVVTLVLTINNSNTGIDEQTACNRFTWIDGNTYTASNNTATHTLQNVYGCDSVVTLNLTVNYSNNYEFDDEACDSYTWNGATYAQSGDYTYAGTNVDGCDSVVTLHLTINNSVAANVAETACDSYTWETGDGQTYTESGNYVYTTTAVNGCDSVVTLALTINKSNSEEITLSACDSYEWNDVVYTESGEYTFNTTNAAGCDSTAKLILTINASTEGVDVQTACDTYTWIDNNVYTASNNTATYTLTNAAGCDSIVKLNLTLNTSVATSFTDEGCDAYTWANTYYTESGVYTKTFEAANGCDSVVTLTLTINQPVAVTLNETACGNYTWNGITYNASGSYTQTGVAANGCDSVTTLNLTINQPVADAFSDEACESYTWNTVTYTESGVYTQTFPAANGCDSVVTLTLTINAPANTTEDVTACESYTWHEQIYTTNGAYTYNFTDGNGCAAVATLNLTINTPANTTETVATCVSYVWNNETYTNSGTYTNTFVDVNGCNATATLNLTINQPVNANVSDTACENYTWNGQTYYASGNYTYTLTAGAANGCDSVTTLNLTINQPTTESVYQEACGSFTWNGETYTQSGMYPYHTTNVNGCDSTVTLLLNISQPYQTVVSQTACDSYTWDATGVTYTTSGNYSDTTTAANGCDSVVTLNLTINTSATTNFAETACVSYSWNGQTYTTSGAYTQVFIARNGCDSTVTLNLTINTPTTATVNETQCTSFDWNGETYTTSGVYTYTTTGANGCDSVTTLNLTINLPVYVNLEITANGSYTWAATGETYTESGVYTFNTTAANGCDSIVTLNLTINPVYTITLISANEEWGTVSENGTQVENGYFTATATANEGYEFVAWMNGSDTVSTSSIYVFQVTDDVILVAIFAEAEVQGINTVDMNNVVIYSSDTRIFVNGAEGYDVYVYDVNGRVISRQLKAADAIEFRMPTTGVYLVKVGNAPAKRVIVVR